MPRYHFHLRGSGATDIDGDEFQDDAAAIAEAKLVAHDLRKGDARCSPNERIVVTNEKCDTIHEEPLDGPWRWVIVPMPRSTTLN